MHSLVDKFGRTISYARLSVTDRCDFRCVYCMAETMTFLPKANILSLEELLTLAKVLIDCGITKIRLTGGEPLVRNNILWLIEKIAQLDGLQELSLTTNGSQLDKIAKPLHDAGLNRINISLDSLQKEKFKQITRTGSLNKVLSGIEATINAGFKNTKINSVILKNRNDDEIIDLLNFALSNQLDIAYIEEMPLGNIIEHDRQLAFCSSDEVANIIKQHYQLKPNQHTSNGPSRYFTALAKDSTSHQTYKSKVGFISPHSHNFCSTCNRIRITVEGKLLFCLGNEHAFDLKPLCKSANNNTDAIAQAIKDNLHLKPEKHHFDLSNETDIVRFMNMTGG